MGDLSVAIIFFWFQYSPCGSPNSSYTSYVDSRALALTLILLPLSEPSPVLQPLLSSFPTGSTYLNFFPFKCGISLWMVTTGHRWAN